MEDGESGAVVVVEMEWKGAVAGQSTRNEQGHCAPVIRTRCHPHPRPICFRSQSHSVRHFPSQVHQSTDHGSRNQDHYISYGLRVAFFN